LTELGYGTPPGRRLAGRIDRSTLEDVITIITVHEQMRGALSKLASSKSVEEQALAYAGLTERMQLLSKFSHLPFDKEAGTRFMKLRKLGIRIGTMDLRIACIVMEHDAVLLTRNTKDFEKVPGLKFENWLE
jgi:tRNA(fMet)-specific endonuclease VapC